MRSALDPKYIGEAEEALGTRFPAAYRSLFAHQNGGTHYDEPNDEWWRLLPIRDSSDRKRLARTCNDVVYETNVWRKWDGAPQDGVCIALDGSGDALVLLPVGDRLDDAVHRWDHETRELTPFMKTCADFSLEP